MVGKTKTHVLIVGSPFKGHAGLFLQTLYALEARHPGLTVTYVADKSQIAVLSDILTRGELRNLNLRTEVVFGEPALFLEIPKFPIRGLLIAEQQLKDCQEWRKTLVAQKDAPGQPTVLLADFIDTWAKDLADELSIPCYIYASVNPLFALNHVYAPKLIEAKLIPDRFNTSAASQSVVVEGYPGFPAIRVRDQFEEFFVNEEYFAHMNQAMNESAGVVLNTADELDRPVGTVEALRNLLPSARIWTIGPRIQMPGFGAVFSRTTEQSCLDWLDRQPDRSVLYVAFGTVGSVSKEEMAELAAGIEASGVRFLWAILLDDPEQLPGLLPPGFVERTKDRGLVVPRWVPQTKILAHASTGGFFSHSGWNSTLESICAGQPMISWPLGADQPLTSRYIHHIAKIGLAICYAKGENHDAFENIDGKDVEKSIRCLMSDGQEARQLRTNVQELQKVATAAVAKGGSSYEHLHKFIDEIANA